MFRIRFLIALGGLLPVLLLAKGLPPGVTAIPPATPPQGNDGYSPVSVTPPPPPREFRGAWLVTVANIDWPSKPGLTVAAQKAELIALLDRAVQLKLNAIIFQVRPSCDAVYYLSPRAVVGISHRHDGPGAAAVLRPARLCHRRGAPARTGTARVVQSVPRAASAIQIAGRAESHFADPPGTRPPLRRPALARPRRPGGAGLRPARGHGRGASATTWMACSSTIIFIPTRKRTRRGANWNFPTTRPGKNTAWPAVLSTATTGGAQNVNQFIQQRLSIHQGREAVGEVRHQPVRHLAADESAANPGHGRLREDFTRIRACGWPTAGWIIFRRNFTGRWSRRSRVFPPCSTGGCDKIPRAGTSGRGSTPPMSAKSGGRTKSTGKSRSRAARPARGGEIFYHLRNLTDNPALATVDPRRISASRAGAGVAVAGFHAAGQTEADRGRKQPVQLERALGNRRRTGLAVGSAVPHQRSLDDGNSAGRSNDTDVWKCPTGGHCDHARWIGPGI